MPSEELWSSDDEQLPELSTTASSTNSSHPLWQLVFFLLLWQSVYKVSNAAITCLLRFLKVFVRAFGRAYSDMPLHHVLDSVPSNADNAHRYVWGCKGSNFLTYVVCPACDSIYDYEACINSTGTEMESKKCMHVPYPNHPHASKWKECGALLLKKVRSGRNCKLVPIKAYPYQPLRISLGRLVKKKGFIEACEQWRQRQPSIPQSYYGDVYDAQVWNDFGARSPSCSMFLSSPYCYMFTLNVDWFQPFIHTEYSLGAIYLTIQNLPREQRYKEENVILVGLLPGPSEPKLSINSYLSPLIVELNEAWENGITLKTFNGTDVTFRAALTCISCDLPASKKVCGFLSHNAKYGCNKCMKPFATPVLGQTDYSGYDISNWQLRTAQKHRLDCNEILKQTTKTGIRGKESEVGCRFSVLLHLPYFDPIRHTVIDFMHNLYLGTGKRVFKLWVSLGLLGKNELSIAYM